MNNRIFYGYFIILFSFIPASIIIGPAISLINIVLIDLSFVFLILYKKEYKFLSNKIVKFILFFYLYLIFNSIISKDFSMGAFRNFGFIRFGILFLAFNYFFYNKSFLNKVLIVWTITLLLLSIDIYVESIFGENILGYGKNYGERIVSFFRDEPIAGGYINGFFLIIIGYFFNLNNKISNKYIVFIFSFFLFSAILLTGERSNTIKAFLGLLTFYSFNDLFNLKKKTIFILLFIFLFSFLLNGSDYLKTRYFNQLVKPITFLFMSDEEITKKYQGHSKKYFQESSYYKIYKSGFTVFTNYPILGVGNKNYRLETCENIKNSTYICNTHPHQIYLEFLAEHGIIGTIILFFILFELIFSKIKIIFNSKNYLQLGCLIFLITSFIPFLPSGAFFADYNLTIFWVNLSMMYAVGKKTNIYN
jgi:O-antigen ligase